MSVSTNKVQQRLRRQVLHTWRQYALPTQLTFHLALADSPYDYALLAVLLNIGQSQPMHLRAWIAPEVAGQQAEIQAWCQAFELECGLLPVSSTEPEVLMTWADQALSEPVVWCLSQGREHSLQQFAQNLCEVGQLAMWPIKQAYGRHTLARPFWDCAHGDILRYSRGLGLEDLSLQVASPDLGWIAALDSDQRANLWRSLSLLEPATLADSLWLDLGT